MLTLMSKLGTRILTCSAPETDIEETWKFHINYLELANHAVGVNPVHPRDKTRGREVGSLCSP